VSPCIAAPYSQARDLERAHRAGARDELQRPAERREPGEHRRADGVEGVEIRAGEVRPPPPVAGAQRIERASGLLEVTVEDGRAAVVERVGRAGAGVHPLQAVLGQRHAGEHGRCRGGRVHGRERVVAEAGQGQLVGAHGPARAVGGLEHDHSAACPREADGGGEAVGPGADDDRVRAHACSASRSASWWSMLIAARSP
jgi:hypothetical protein